MKLPRSLIALPVRWTTSLDATVTDDAGVGRSVTMIASGTLWTRTFLAPATGGTSQNTPKDLLRHIDAALNAAPAPGGQWSVTMTAAGRVRIAYSGSGTGAVTWGAAVAVGRALGFSGNLSIPTGTHVDGDTLPAFCWFPYSLDSDTGFRAEHSLLSAALHANGAVTAFDEGTQLVTRTFRARYAPATESVRTTRALYATPFYPPSDEPTRWTAPSIVPEDCPEAWTVHETLSCAIGLRCAYALGDLQSLIAGSSTGYYEGAVDPESVRSRGDRAALSVAAYSSLVDVPSITLSMRTTGTR